MRSWFYRAYHTHRIGMQQLGSSPIELILGQGCMHWLRRASMHMRSPLGSEHQPIVIAGLPRTGTTFLHRFLHAQKIGQGLTLWQQLFPSPLLRRMLHPVKPLLSSFSPTRHHREEIHRTGFDYVETDEAALFFQYLDGFFLYAFFWAFDDEDHREFFDRRSRDVSARDFSWLTRCWEQNTVDCMPPLAKLFGVGAQVPQFQHHFPQSKILYTVRDPCAVIPSTLSLLTAVLSERFAWDQIPQQKKQRYYQRICDALIELMSRFHMDWSTGKINQEQCLVIPYRQLNSDFIGTMNRIFALMKYHPTAEQCHQLESVSQKQKKRKSQHHYALSTYGLDEDDIRARTEFFSPYWRV